MAQQEPQREPFRDDKPPDREVFSQKPTPSVTKINRVINYGFSVLEGLILIRMLITGLGGNPGNAFVDFIHSITEPFVFPFLTVFGSTTLDTGIGFVEIGAILAIFFYILLNYAIVRLIWILSSKN